MGRIGLDVRALILSACVLAGACSPGMGRAPVYPDASEPIEAGYPDAPGIYPDASRPDSGVTDGTITTFDSGPPPSYPFTGIYGILNDRSPLYAREVQGHLNLVVAQWPYVYTGTITAGGNVDTSSLQLKTLGCQNARISGVYDRETATYNLFHETCNANGDPLSSNITGGFVDNFVPTASGIFQLQITVNAPGGGCYEGALTGNVGLYAMDFVGRGEMHVFCAIDVISTQEWYRGAASNDFSFSGLDPSFNVAIRGSFDQPTANDPLHFTGLRDVFDPVKGCGFSMTLDGYRIDAP